MSRWLVLLILIVAGIALGLFYGWVISPVKFVDTTPASLRADYQTDYVLMVAEAYHSDQNAELASRHLAIFGGQAPSAISQTALEMAQRLGYSQNDLSLIRELTRAMQAAQPASTAVEDTPGNGNP